ncbi:CDP-alcohol phosphatidyltransferase family protein [Candidatus Fermentibacteria bacterium]|nr:CDP-alcohol phosphatidyltransferase family protein [Candidatus Fermentibacteria bacterium]
MRLSGPFFNVPNMVSISRIPLSCLASYMLWREKVYATAALIVLAILSDAVDGWIARKTSSVTDWGKILDPLADKVGFAIFILTLTLMGRLPVWFLLVVVGRDAILAGGGLLVARRLRYPPSSNLWGKASTVILSLYLIRQVLLPTGGVLLGVGPLGLVALALVLTSLVVYITSSSKLLLRDSGTPEPPLSGGNR